MEGVKKQHGDRYKEITGGWSYNAGCMLMSLPGEDLKILST